MLSFILILFNNNLVDVTMGKRLHEESAPIDLKTFSKNLRNARKDAGLSQEDLVKKTGLSQAFISGVESGKNVGLKNASILAEAVGATLRDLLDRQKK